MMSFSLETMQIFFKNALENFFKERVILEGQCGNNYIIKDINTGMIAMHSFPIDHNIDEYYNKFITIENNKFEKILKIFKICKNMCFISNRNNENQSIIKFIEYMENSYNKHIIYINIEYSKYPHIKLQKKYKIHYF